MERAIYRAVGAANWRACKSARHRQGALAASARPYHCLLFPPAIEFNYQIELACLFLPKALTNTKPV
jgi:hypothetical protein